MTDTNDERLAAVVRAVCSARREGRVRCNYPDCACGKDPDDVYVRAARAAIAADDAYHADKARGMMTEEVVETAAKASYDYLLGAGSWEQLASPTDKRYTIEGTRSALEAVAPMLVPCAPLPAEVTDHAFLAGFDAYAEWCRERGLAPNIRATALRLAINTAIAAAPKAAAPGHTDLMVAPETLDEFLARNPLPTPAASDCTTHNAPAAPRPATTAAAVVACREAAERFAHVGIVQPADLARAFDELAKVLEAKL